jgi:outer membrane protein
MKKLMLLSFIMLTISAVSMAQKYAFVDTEYILSKIPSYESAQTKLDDLSKTWQAEIEAKYKVVETKYKEFQTEQYAWSAEMKKQREQEIIELENQAVQLREKYFGDEGDLYNKRTELVKPIQDEVFNAIKTVATEGGYAMIFDKASGASLIYTDPKYDISDEIVKKLGY